MGAVGISMLLLLAVIFNMRVEFGIEVVATVIAATVPQTHDSVLFLTKVGMVLSRDLGCQVLDRLCSNQFCGSGLNVLNLLPNVNATFIVLERQRQVDSRSGGICGTRNVDITVKTDPFLARFAPCKNIVALSLIGVSQKNTRSKHQSVVVCCRNVRGNGS